MYKIWKCRKIIFALSKKYLYTSNKNRNIGIVYQLKIVQYLTCIPFASITTCNRLCIDLINLWKVSLLNCSHTSLKEHWLVRIFFSLFSCPKYAIYFSSDWGEVTMITFGIDFLHYIATITSQCMECALGRYLVGNNMK